MTRYSRPRFSTGLRLGILGAVGFAVWLGISVVKAVAAGPVGINATSRIETIIVGLLICYALFTAMRFGKHGGWISGPVLLVVVTVETAKRIILRLQEIAPFDIIDIIIVVLIALGLLNGIRAVQAIRDGAVL